METAGNYHIKHLQHSQKDKYSLICGSYILYSYKKKHLCRQDLKLVVKLSRGRKGLTGAGKGEKNGVEGYEHNIHSYEISLITKSEK